MNPLSGRPPLIFKKESSRAKGKNVIKSNISAAKMVAEIVKSTLGPRGMKKLLIPPQHNRLVITSDGATILDEIEIHHPIGKVIVDIAKAFDNAVGDGTTTTIVLTGEILKNAEPLLEERIHPTIIIGGLKMAMDYTIKILDELAEPIDVKDREALKNVALTSITGGGAEVPTDHFADIAVEAIKPLVERGSGGLTVNLDDIQFVKKAGGSLNDTELINGVIVDRRVADSRMPKIVRNAKIALIKFPLECSIARQRPGYASEIKITEPHEMKAFIDAEAEVVGNIIDKIEKAGANVLMCGSRVDETARYFLAERGIMTVQKVRDSVMEKLSKATGGKIIKNPADIRRDDLGSCGLVEEKKFGKDAMVFVQDCKDPRSVSILIRAGLERHADEAERVLKDALSALVNVFKKNKIVAGGGAVEVELAKKLRGYARKISGREQLGIIALADALEVIPKILSSSAGLDPINILLRLRTLHEEREGKWQGIDVLTGEIKDMMREGIVEPLSTKELIIKTAVEASSMILRVDDLIMSPKSIG